MADDHVPPSLLSVATAQFAFSLVSRTNMLSSTTAHVLTIIWGSFDLDWHARQNY
jgi:hypothetical protein